MSTTDGIFRSMVTAVVVAGLAMAGPAMATELKLAHFMSPKHSLQTQVWEPLAKDLAAATDGELQLKIYPAGQLGAGPNEQYNRVINGVADIVHGLPGYTSALFPKTLLIELPGITRSDDVATRGLWNAMPLIEDEYRRIKLLAVFTSASAILMTRDKPIRSPEDMEGQKIRIPSANAGKAIAAWGGTPVSMPISEVYQSLQTGVIDGVLLNASSLINFKLHEVTSYYTVNVPSTTSVMFFLMNRKSWANLSDEEQAVLDRYTGRELSIRVSKVFQDAHEAGLELAHSMPDKTVIELTPQQADRFQELSQTIIDNVVADLEEQGVQARAIVEAMGAF